MNIVQHRFPRLITGAFLPAVVFAFITTVLISLGIRLPLVPDAFGSLPGFIGLILSGWVLAGVQSLIYSVVMEFCVNPRVENRYLVTSISGLFISIITWSVFPVGFPFVLLGIGCMAGCVVGYFLRDMYKYYS